jgi:hypothetical protein
MAAAVLIHAGKVTNYCNHESYQNFRDRRKAHTNGYRRTDTGSWGGPCRREGCRHLSLRCTLSVGNRMARTVCPDVAMIGKDRDGGYAEFICVPERNAFTLPGEIPFTHAAVMMCSSSERFIDLLSFFLSQHAGKRGRRTKSRCVLAHAGHHLSNRGPGLVENLLPFPQITWVGFIFFGTPA